MILVFKRVSSCYYMYSLPNLKDTENKTTLFWRMKLQIREVQYVLSFHIMYTYIHAQRSKNNNKSMIYIQRQHKVEVQLYYYHHILTYVLQHICKCSFMFTFSYQLAKKVFITICHSIVALIFKQRFCLQRKMQTLPICTVHITVHCEVSNQTVFVASIIK